LTSFPSTTLFRSPTARGLWHPGERRGAQAVSTLPRHDGKGRQGLLCRRFRNSHILIRAAVIKQPAILLTDHAFDKDDVGHLANSSPLYSRRENRAVRA